MRTFLHTIILACLFILDYIVYDIATNKGILTPLGEKFVPAVCIIATIGVIFLFILDAKNVANISRTYIKTILNLFQNRFFYFPIFPFNTTISSLNIAAVSKSSSFTALFISFSFNFIILS